MAPAESWKASVEASAALPRWSRAIWVRTNGIDAMARAARIIHAAMARRVLPSPAIHDRCRDGGDPHRSAQLGDEPPAPASDVEPQLDRDERGCDRHRHEPIPPGRRVCRRRQSGQQQELDQREPGGEASPVPASGSDGDRPSPASAVCAAGTQGTPRHRSPRRPTSLRAAGRARPVPG